MHRTGRPSRSAPARDPARAAASRAGAHARDARRRRAGATAPSRRSRWLLSTGSRCRRLEPPHGSRICDVVLPMTLPPFQVLIDEHRDDVYRFLRASVGAHDADDCFQETFIAALRAYPRLRADSNLRGWLFTIAHHKALDSHRARNRRAIPVNELPETVGEPLMNGGEPELWRAGGGLPATQRAAVLLRFAGDLASREIGEATGTTEEAARRNVHEGLKKLREVWQA